MTAGTKFIKEVVDLAKKAGIEAKKIYDQGDASVETKMDNSPLTNADRICHEVICAGLQSLGQIPILSEESDDDTFSKRRCWNEYWLVDPLDGTKEFVNRSGDFTINIALIAEGMPALGVVYAPVIDEMYFAVKGEGAYRILSDERLQQLKVRNLQVTDEFVGLISRSHKHDEDKKITRIFPDVSLVPMGSSLKFCKIAAGEADFYFRNQPTSEWDTAAAQAVLEEAGGFVLNLEGEPLHYNKTDILNPSFIAFGDPVFSWERLAGA